MGQAGSLCHWRGQAPPLQRIGYGMFFRTKDEAYKIRCTVKHFGALAIKAKVDYIAPVKEYATFKTRVEELTHG